MAALILAYLGSESNKAPEMIKVQFNKEHGTSFETMRKVIEEADQQEVRQFIDDNVVEHQRAWVLEVLAL